MRLGVWREVRAGTHVVEVVTVDSEPFYPHISLSKRLLLLSVRTICLHNVDGGKKKVPTEFKYNFRIFHFLSLSLIHEAK